MQLLLDTHVWLWLLDGSPRLPAETTELLADPAHQLSLSVASIWEVGVKHAAGRLDLPVSPQECVRLSTWVTVLRIEAEDALAAAGLPRLHGDPFDRLLVAQAQRRELTILTADRVLSGYDVQVLPV